MITVAIIGILAAIAIPAYQNYTIRSRVVEGLSLANGAKTHVADVLATGNAQGDALGYAYGYSPPSGTVNVALLEINSTTGVITVNYNIVAGNGTLTLTPNAPAGVQVPDATKSFSPPVGVIAWRCLSNNADPGVFKGTTAATLPQQYAPSECR